ncbi:MAG: GMC family oxidoreductase [Sterolibacterium sp.]|nr:GMC family oxidoreductase [Sterolibacterium sp.]
MDRKDDFDYIVIGSGFGGSVSALRLAEKGYRVGVMEMGRRWTAETLPKTNWSLRRWLWVPQIGLRGFFNISLFKRVIVLHGNAVGGGSITYANVLLVPPDRVWEQGSWAGLRDWKAIMPAHYATAQRMLGVTENRLLGPADHRLRDMAKVIGVADSFYATPVGVYFGEPGDAPGTTRADPYFNGQGPQRTACNACGACMMGCRYNAKNTLDKNYLYLAEQRGVEIRAETRVVDVRPLAGQADGSAGYEVFTRPSTGGRKQPLTRLTCRGVVFAASSLGTQHLLFRLKQRGSLPHIAEALGKNVRTNAESLIGVRFPGSKVDLSTGVAIGSGIHIDQHTHIEATRYPAGSDAMGLLSTLMATGWPRWPWLRPLAWLLTLIKLLLKQPFRTLRMLWPVGYARETMILLCMQTLEGHLDMQLKRPWYWPFSRLLVSSGRPIPVCIPEANEFARKAAAATGGMPANFVPEVFLNIPATAHCMGGAAMGRNRQSGVCDAQNRVFGYRNMYICDGAMLGGNLGVNPSLSITALTEHAMSCIPPAAEQHWQDTGIEQ